MNTSHIHIQQVDALQGLCPTLKSVWQQIAPALPPHLAMYTFEWYQNWFEHYAAKPPWTGGSCTLIAYHEDRAVAILPLAVRRQSKLSILSLAGFYQPLRTWLCTQTEAEAAGAAMAQHLLNKSGHWDICRLTPIDDGTPERHAFEKGLREHVKRLIETPLGRTIVHPVKPSMEDYQQSKTIKRIQSYERRFLREESAEVVHYSNPDGEMRSRMLTHLADIEAHSWLAREGGDLRFASETDRAFWNVHLADPARVASPFNAWMAMLHGQPVGFRVVLTSGDIDYMIANQFDEKHAELRLGWVLYIYHLREAVTRGVRLIDSAPGDFHYKGRLGSEEAEMRKSLLLFPDTLKGLLLFHAIRTCDATRKTLERSRYGRCLAQKLPRI